MNTDWVVAAVLVAVVVVVSAATPEGRVFWIGAAMASG